MAKRPGSFVQSATLRKSMETLKEVRTGQEELGDRMTDGTLIKYQAGVTVSGRYQTVNISIGIELPTVRDKCDRAFSEAKDIVSSRIAQELPEAKKILHLLVKEHEQKYGGK